MPLKVTDTPIRGVVVVQRSPFSDKRGSFQRLFDFAVLEAHLGTERVVQINHVRTASAGTVRGLHIQMPPHSESKLVVCVRGAVFDVAVDLRPESPTFGKWFGQELSATNNEALLLPAGCAHGIQALQDDCEIVYVHTSGYQPESELGLSPLNQELGVSWPLPVMNLSARDASCVTKLDEFAEVVW